MSSKNKFKIIWQKWVDPFGYDDIDEAEEAGPDQDYYEDYENEEQNNNGKNLESYSGIYNPKYVKVIATPMGVIPINENTASNKIFNFWMGHTNFDITKDIVDTIEETSGVESLDIFTRYRFRISVGKAFDDSQIMRDINDRVYEHLDIYD
jgi:hypothetical protein